jgi:hypothetical protein
MACDFRARQIAEAVKPWREAAKNLTRGVDSIAMLNQSGDLSAQAGGILFKDDILAARALLASEAGKTGG